MADSSMLNDYRYFKNNIQFLTSENTTYNQKFMHIQERIHNMSYVNGLLFYLFYFSFFIFFVSFCFASKFHWTIKIIVFLLFFFYPFYIFNLELFILYIYQYLMGIINGVPYDRYIVEKSGERSS